MTTEIPSKHCFTMFTTEYEAVADGPADLKEQLMEFLPERLCILLCLRKETLQILGSPLFATDYFQL